MTHSERMFVEFCALHELPCRPVPPQETRTTDFEVQLAGLTVAVEIKALEEMSGWNPGGVHTRKPGLHVRHKIEEARKQIQVAAEAGSHTILLIYNAVDPMQLFGTEQHDFLAAMYGDLTWHIADGQLKGLYHGRSSAFRENMNTSFSAVGHLLLGDTGPRIHVYENAHARRQLPYAELPQCISFNKVQIESAA
jgi:hypothetical protein